MLLSVSVISFSVTAGDENDPEIVDEEDDIFGPLIEKPNLFERLKKLRILDDIENFDFIDIVSAWFYENSDEPDYLITSIKVKNLDLKKQRAIYAMHFVHNEIEYTIGVHTHSDGSYKHFIAGNRNEGYNAITGSFDLDNNIINFKIPKHFIGSPDKGDVLTKTDAWNALRLVSGGTLIVSGDGELVKDWAGYGKDYTIQYEPLGIPAMHDISGASNVQPDHPMDYTFTATDPYNQDVYYYIDWGDGEIIEWVGAYASGSPLTINHTWAEIGGYTIKAKAKDRDGLESEWMTKNIYVTKSRNVYSILMKLLQNYPHLQLLIQLLSEKIII
jgi:hypothetical protein